MLPVRFRSSLPRDEVVRIMRGRMPELRAIEGLQRKYYLEDRQAGEYAGLYLWRSQEELAEFSESELRATIAQAYGVEGQPRVEVYSVLEPPRGSRPAGRAGVRLLSRTLSVLAHPEAA